MTPVELGSTWRGANPSMRSRSALMRADASTPPGAQTLEILLFTTIAPRVGFRQPLATDDDRARREMHSG